MEKVTKKTENIIAAELPECFAVLDGWSKASTHFVGVFASYPVDCQLGFKSRLNTYM